MRFTFLCCRSQSEDVMSHINPVCYSNQNVSCISPTGEGSHQLWHKLTFGKTQSNESTFIISRAIHICFWYLCARLIMYFATSGDGPNPSYSCCFNLVTLFLMYINKITRRELSVAAACISNSNN